ncbi:MAG TPA: polyphosphate kinase 1 [Longimicrobiales bacterium]|nr:polyphosphate kinase 1 [Longimicrobiales bacterium]
MPKRRSPTPSTVPLLDRETSWLRFEARVLQEAADPRVPLFERLFFCGIFSANLDEYFRVRVASLRSLLRLGKGSAAKLGIDPHRLLHEIHRIVSEQQERYGRILAEIFAELAAAGVRRVDEHTVDPAHHEFLRCTFDERVRPLIEPRPLDGPNGPPFLENNTIHLVVELWNRDQAPLQSWTPTYVLVDVPSSRVGRFVTLPKRDATDEVMFLDDVIRFNLDRLFPDHDVGRSYAVKLTRDAELHVDDEFQGDVVRAIRSALAKRQMGMPSRFLYDMRMPYVLIHRLQHGLGLAEEDLVLGGRYHNLRDYLDFPRFGRTELCYPEWPPHPHPVLDGAEQVLATVAERDLVLHLPYQSFAHVVRFLEEAARDPAVEEMWLTVYRVTRDSQVLSALLEAAERGKRVTVFMEVKARFDEETNLAWAERLRAAGATVLYSLDGLKVHAKMALVVRAEAGDRRRYAYLATGNFNERTARVYTDHGLFTCDERITADVEQVFRFLAGELAEPRPRHLLVAPFTLRGTLERLVAHEAARAAEGRPSGITLKLNALEDDGMIAALVEASSAGVPIDLIVRSICRLVPGVPGRTETVRARSVVDRYLEHGRIYRFHHDGEERLYVASADWMTRNLSHRVEIAIPVYHPEVRRQLRAVLDLQLADDCKARLLDAAGENPYAPAKDGGRVRAQEAFRDFVAGLRG